MNTHVQQTEVQPRTLPVGDALDRATLHLLSAQQDRGAWAGEAVWSTMLTSQVVLASHAIGRELPEARREAILRTLSREQRPDGSWPMHPESGGYVFTTALAYVALRLLGVGPDDQRCTRARAALDRLGGVTGIPSWGKVWLSLVGLWRWDGVEPVLPELWLLPEALPLHPWRYYCHTRLIYLPMGVLSALRWQGQVTDTIRAVRDELYGPGGFERTRFSRLRASLAESDVYVRPSVALRAMYRVSGVASAVLPWPVRRRAIDRCLTLIRGELETTRHACISPVNGLLNVVALHAADPDDPAIGPAWDAVDAWRWEDEQGARWVGARSDTWDTSFVVQALATRPGAVSVRALARASEFLLDHQVRTEFPDPAAIYRDPRKGGFCFSDSHHLWPVSDTTAEAVAALLALEERRVIPRVADDRLREACEFILQRQNPDGGFGSYERRRGGRMLEKLNPSEMFGSCMTEASYVECTASCVKALALLTERVGDEKLCQRARKAIARGRDRLLALQEETGAWQGVWGVGTTYGTLFGIDGLLHAGVPATAPAIRRAVRWLESIQRPDGAWGEHWTTCTTKKYVPHEEGQAVQTAWAVLAILMARLPGEPVRESVRRGVTALLAKQGPDGGWPDEQSAGVFFHTAVLDYRLYTAIFPTWALAAVERETLRIQEQN